MNKIKWAFFGYLLACGLILVGMGVSFAITRTRDSNTLYGSYHGNLKTLDPAEVGDAGAADLDGYVYECLYNYAYGEDQYRLIPELAVGDPVVTDGGLTVTIHIKPGVHFYDPQGVLWPGGRGPEVTADDFIYSWRRVCNFQSGYTSNYGMVFQGRVVGIDDWFAYTRSCQSPQQIDWARPIEGLRALDRYTLQIRLTAPFPQLQFNLALMQTAVVSREAVEHYGDTFKNHPVGTGAYAMSEYLPDPRSVYTANPLYRGGPDVSSGADLPAEQRMPFVKRVQLNCFDETLPPWYLFLQGKLDASAIPKDTFGQAISEGGNLTDAMRADGIGLTKYKNPWVTFLAFNMNDPVVGKNKALRQAISLAFDRQRYIDIYLNGRAVAANGPIPPGFPTFDPKRVAPYCRFDLAAAKEKLAEAVRFNGGPIPPLHLLYGDTTTALAQQADFVASQLRRLGLTVLSDFKPYGTFLSMMDRGQFQIYSNGWVADYPDEQDYWQLYYGKNVGPGGLNGTNYRNPEFDRLYEQAAVMTPGPQRTAIYGRLQEMVLEDCPMLFISYPVTYQLYHGWMQKPWISAYGYGFRQYTQLDVAARDAWIKRH
ncbi:MAG: ABC transporter substrate-binding protein [Tepidisphaeraceae bacterium]